MLLSGRWIIDFPSRLTWVFTELSTKLGAGVRAGDDGALVLSLGHWERLPHPVVARRPGYGKGLWRLRGEHRQLAEEIWPSRWHLVKAGSAPVLRQPWAELMWQGRSRGGETPH